MKKINENHDEDNSDKQMPAAGLVFEKSFMSADLEQLIGHCDHYELVDCFKKWLPSHQPILEAGSGSGRWVGWFTKRGWQAAGLDWSTTLCERARLAIPEARFEVGDMREMPFDSGEFGAIVSLGAIEHSPEGPMRSLKEYYRVLRPGGIAIITVPYLGPVRKLMRFIGRPKMFVKKNKLLRILFGKNTGSRSFHDAQKEIIAHYSADYLMSENGWEFFQYLFTKPQMCAFLAEANFEIIEEFVEFTEEGILHNFGRIAGVFDFEKGKASLSWAGRILRKTLPASSTGHMLCYIVMKK